MSSVQINLENGQRKDMQILVSSAADLHRSPPSPHQLATMTNVNVLDLHKDYGDATKVYDKETNTVYVYSNKPLTNPPPGEVVETIVETTPAHSSSIAIASHAGMLQRISANNHDHIIDGRLITPTSIHQESHMPRPTPTGEPITRLVDDQFIQRLVENQEVVSRDFVNGEHHIITRNENGEHILTRIVSNTDHKLIPGENGAIYAHTDTDTLPPTTPTTVLHYEKNESINNKHHTIYANTESGVKQETGLKQVIYTHSSGDKEIMYADAKSGEVYSTINAEDKNHVDLIYEDGNKTVIYTTAGDQKTVELYQSGELGMIGENQVIIQGGLQYTAQPGPNGTTVYVLSEMPDGEDVNSIER